MRKEQEIECPVCSTTVTLKDGRGRCSKCKAFFKFGQLSESDLNMEVIFSDLDEREKSSN